MASRSKNIKWEISDLQNESLADFAHYLAAGWKRLDFSVCLVKDRDNEAQSLSDLMRAYLWKGKNFEETETKLTKYSDCLRNSIQEEDNESLYLICRSIMKWGGVYSANYTKNGSKSKLADVLERHHNESSLPAWISSSIDHLKTGRFEQFDGKSYFSNSTMTKIHALGDTRNSLIIYDGRVGAALGFLAKMFLNKGGRRFCLTSSSNLVPKELGFAHMPARKSKKSKRRDPSEGHFKFRSYATDNALHARCNYIASECIRQSKELLEDVTEREIEAALFMLGDDLNQIRTK